MAYFLGCVTAIASCVWQIAFSEQPSSLLYQLLNAMDCGLATAVGEVELSSLRH